MWEHVIIFTIAAAAVVADRVLSSRTRQRELELVGSVVEAASEAVGSAVATALAPPVTGPGGGDGDLLSAVPAPVLSDEDARRIVELMADPTDDDSFYRRDRPEWAMGPSDANPLTRL